MISGQWQYTAQSVSGRRHQQLGQPCQDAHRITLSGTTFAIVVADGAGSATYADIGAELAVTAAIKELAACRDVPDTRCGWEIYLWEMLKTLRQHLMQYADKYGADIHEFATTLL
jgi:hypothetical protein